MSGRASFVAVPYRYSLSLPSRPVSPKPHPSSGYSLLTPTIQAQRWVASHNFDQLPLISYLIAQDPLTRASIETKAFVSDAASRWRRCLALTPGHCLDSIRLSSKSSSPAFLSLHHRNMPSKWNRPFLHHPHLLAMDASSSACSPQVKAVSKQ